MRTRTNLQCELDFHPSNLKLTNEYYTQYDSVSNILDQNPKVLDHIHKDLQEALEAEASNDYGGGTFRYTSDNVLRNKGWEHFAATVGATIFTHNILILARQ